MHELQIEILEQLGAQFSAALEGMLGERWPSSLQPSIQPDASTRYLCWSQRFNLHADPLVQVAIDDATWREIGKQALSSVGLEEPEESDIRATYLELLTQALSGLARFLTGKAGSEVSLEAGTEVPLTLPHPDGPFRCLRLTNPGGSSTDLFVHISSQVVAALGQGGNAESANAVNEQRTSEPMRAAATAGAGSNSNGSQSASPSLEVLLDVEMPVSVSFGRTQLPLKEVIKLSTGSIVELNRTIAEPVEVIVNNCVIARGEVVVVEGNYGVRIMQVVSRSDRLKTFD
ncbi:MAG TPA: flagellar motor switch protein FliN [Bryobacteraceae bacterium]|nr:flagellar motor switch protein FliN [Bryobacteraceae bacterium]